MRQVNFIVRGQFFSHPTATHRNAPHRYRCFRKLPFKIHYKKMSATRRIGVSRPLVSGHFWQCWIIEHQVILYSRDGQPVARVPLVAHTKSLYINEDSQEFTFSWKYFPHLSFMPYETWSCDIVEDSVRYTLYYVKKKNISIMNLVKCKYRSTLANHHLKNLLLLVTSSTNSNIEELVKRKNIQRSYVFHVNARLIRHFSY